MERLKQKVASSRVFASFQQVAGQSSSASSSTTGASDNRAQASQPMLAPTEKSAENEEFRQPALVQVPKVVPEAAMSTAWLMAADATAHLTDEERGILLEVFKKEEQFQRDTIKQLTASRAQLEQAQQLREQQEQLQRQQKENRRPSRRLLAKYRAASNQSLAYSPSSTSYTPTSGSLTQPASRACSCSASTGAASSTCSLHATPTPSDLAARGRSADPSSSTGATNNNNNTSEQPLDFGQCRICRKTIGSSEPCHLCSNCQQFVCDDCASYSSTDQHWMCSSCRRRAMTPAIPAEALKELGLNQNSSAVRRMTLRLNQNELKLALDRKNSSALIQQHQMAQQQQQQQQQQAAAESTTSSSSNSAASSNPHCAASRSNSTRAGVQTPQGAGTPTRAASKPTGGSQPKLQPDASRVLPSRPQGQRSLERVAQERKRTGRISSSPGSQRAPQHAGSCDGLLKSRSATSQQTQASRSSSASQNATGSRVVGGSASASPSSGGGTRRSYCEMRASKLVAQKTMSQPIATSQECTPQTGCETSASNEQQQLAPAIQRQMHQRQVQQHQQQQQQWCASEAKRPNQMRADNDDQQQHRTSVAAPLSSQSLGGASVQPIQHYGQQYYSPEHLMQQEQTYSAHYGAQHQADQSQQFPQHQHQQLNWGHQPMMSEQSQTHQQAQQPYEMSSFASSSPRTSRRTSRHQLSIEAAPMHQLVPSEQFHMRRLSDQSNLVRRSSIISDNLEGQIARNRSHSNIDTVHQVSSYLNQATSQQQQTHHMRPFHDQQMQQMPYQQRQSDQQLHSTAYLTQETINRAHLSLGQSEHMNSVSTSNVLNLPNEPAQMAHQRRLSDSGQYMIASNFQQHQMASVITSGAQKVSRRRQSFDDGNQPDSSSSDSELDSNKQHAQQAYNGYNFHQKQQAPITIPSVSVSEFRQAARRQSIQLQQQQQQMLQQREEILFAQDNQITPNQINVAIEQVIQQQQQHEQQLLGGNQRLEQQLLQLSARRGSSGRVLPRIPGQQSRSLLELPHSLGGSQQIGGHQQNAMANQQDTQASDANRTGQTLDLPLLSPTIRRASAPEGQNIKIVVDDIDHNQHGVANFTRSAQYQYHQYHTGANSKYYSQHDFYERHILCRDDSLDPNGLQVGRGFGLQVMGGKLDKEGKLQSLITWVLPAGPADKVGLREGDKIIEWDGKCLVDMSYEQVAEVIESSANVAELLVKPTPQRLNDPQQAPTSYLLSGRRLSQQTERDLRRAPQSRGSIAAGPGSIQATPSKRASGGRRKLPQIPGGELSVTHSNGSTTQLDERFSSLRHASTGQLDQNAHLMGTSDLMNQQQLSNSTRSQLGGTHLNPFSGHQQAQQQTRSASELHRGSVGVLNDPSYLHQQQQQQQQQNQQPYIAANTMNGQPLGSWQQAQHQQQYGGSQQILPGHVGGQLSAHHAMSHYGSQMNATKPVGAFDETRGLIGLQVNVDEHLSTLEISILAAHNIERDPSLDYYVRVKILPENTRFKVCTTQPSSDMNWKETFLFQKFPVQNIHRMALEIGIWVHQEMPRLSAEPAQPICEALIPIQSARERHIDFWPMRPPPTSPGGRRKSLNDLMGDHFAQQQQAQHHQQHENNPHDGRPLLSAGYKQASHQPKPPWQGDAIAAVRQIQQQHKRTSPLGSSTRLYQPSLNDSPTMINYYQRERSSSNRNLPEANKLNVQPRRASDEVATSSSHRLLARISPGASRRSISVINVGGDSHSGTSNRSPNRSRLGSQANIMRAAQMRRDSGQQANANNSPKKFSSCSPSGGSVSRASESSQTGPMIGTTPSGRRSSLIGVQSMTGYRSQKSSQSDATDHESPLSLGNKRSRDLTASQLVQQQQVSAPPGGSSEAKVAFRDQQEQQQGQPPEPFRRPSMSKSQQTRQASSGPTSTRQSCSSNAGSRRGSCEQQHAHLQRHGSFAMQTLRKLKRTMSLTKNDSPTGSNQESRRSSDDSTHSEGDLCEDLAVTRTVRPHDVVGRIKLSFIMTKGQFEVEVICASGLKLEHQESALGVYVKMYLKGRSKSNKRKTRVVQQQLDSPIFKQTIRYDGSLVDNKLLEVSVWVKQGTLRGKQPVGLTEIKLADMNLAQLQTSWYNLRSIDTLGSSSIED